MSFPRSLKPTILVLVIIVTTIGLIGCSRSKGQTNAAATASPTPPVILVSAAPAITRQLPGYFEANGNLAANEQTDVAAETSGKVVAVGVDLGSSVRRGQMLVKLDDADFRIRIQQAQA